MSVNASDYSDYNIRKIFFETYAIRLKNFSENGYQIAQRNEEFMKRYDENNKRAANQMGSKAFVHIVSTFLNVGAGLFGILPLFSENIQKFAQNAPNMISSLSQIFTTTMERQQTLYDGYKNIAQINKNDGSSEKQLNDQLLKDLHDFALRYIQSLHVQQR